MSSCARCSVQGSIAIHGKNNVVEIVGVPERDGWIPYNIYTSDTKNRRKRDLPKFSWNGRDWFWVMTVFSESHSLDEDCFCLSTPHLGFPTRISAFEPTWYF